MVDNNLQPKVRVRMSENKEKDSLSKSGSACIVAGNRWKCQRATTPTTYPCRCSRALHSRAVRYRILQRETSQVRHTFTRQLTSVIIGHIVECKLGGALCAHIAPPVFEYSALNDLLTETLLSTHQSTASP